MASCIIFGRLADKIAVNNSMILAGFVAIATSWGGFLTLQFATDVAIIIGQILIGIGVGCFVGPSHAYLQEQFTTEVRYTGVASGFSIGMAVSGGTTLLIMTYVLQQTQLEVPYFLWCTKA